MEKQEPLKRVSIKGSSNCHEHKESTSELHVWKTFIVFPQNMTERLP
jgi:hypothetical protein